MIPRTCLLAPVAWLPLVACADVRSPVEPGSDLPSSHAEFAARLDVPEDHPGNPFYALIFEGLDPSSPHYFFPHDDGWGAVMFERELGCVPTDFNLLEEFDFTPAFPGGPPRPFLCPPTIAGHQVWENAPNPLPVDPGPIQVLSKGLGAVPVILASWDDITDAMADGVLTLPELRGLPSAIEATANQFVALYVNGPAPDDRLMNKVEARGMLPDGTVFQVLANESASGTAYRITMH